MRRPTAQATRDLGCERCQVAWRGEPACWFCGRSDRLVPAHLMFPGRREERVRSAYDGVSLDRSRATAR